MGVVASIREAMAPAGGEWISAPSKYVNRMQRHEKKTITILACNAPSPKNLKKMNRRCERNGGSV